MSENGSSSPKDNDTSSSSSGHTDTNDLSSSSSSSGWKIQYKMISDSKPKGIWAGYQTREEFLMMHLR